MSSGYKSPYTGSHVRQQSSADCQFGAVHPSSTTTTSASINPDSKMDLFPNVDAQGYATIEMIVTGTLPKEALWKKVRPLRRCISALQEAIAMSRYTPSVYSDRLREYVDQVLADTSTMIASTLKDSEVHVHSMRDTFENALGRDSTRVTSMYGMYGPWVGAFITHDDRTGQRVIRETTALDYGTDAEFHRSLTRQLRSLSDVSYPSSVQETLQHITGKVDPTHQHLESGVHTLLGHYAGEVYKLQDPTIEQVNDAFRQGWIRVKGAGFPFSETKFDVYTNVSVEDYNAFVDTVKGFWVLPPAGH